MSAPAAEPSAASVCNSEALILARTPVVLKQPDREASVHASLAWSRRVPTLVLAPSGAGKSTFLANLAMRLRSEAGAEESVVTVFIGATEGSTSVSRVLMGVLDCLDPEGEGGGDFVDLVRRFHEVLLARSAANLRTTLVFDALNEFDAAHSARSLRWLPESLPDNCRVLLSAIEATPPKAAAGDPSAAAVRQVLAALSTRYGLRAGGNGVELLGSLSRDELEQLLRAHLAADFRGKYVTVSGEALEAIFCKPDSTSPLYVQLVAEEVLSVPGGPAGLLPALASFPGTLSAAFDRRLQQLEKGPGGVAAAATLAGVLITHGGLYESQLQTLWLSASAEAVAEQAMGAASAGKAGKAGGGAAAAASTAAGAGLKAARAAAALKSKAKTAKGGAASKAAASSGAAKGRPIASEVAAAAASRTEAGSTEAGSTEEGSTGAGSSASAAALPTEQQRSAVAQLWWAGPMRSILRLASPSPPGAEANAEAVHAPVGFVHMQARDAAHRRYLHHSAEAERRAHARLVASFLAAAEPSADGVWRCKDRLPAELWKQALRRLPLHACGAADAHAAERCLGCLGFVQASVEAGLAFELVNAYAAALSSTALRAAMPAAALARIGEFFEFVKENASMLARAPARLLQQACNAPQDAKALASDALRRTHAAEWVQWANPPHRRPACAASNALRDFNRRLRTRQSRGRRPSARLRRG